jgi:hypothetical protein
LRKLKQLNTLNKKLAINDKVLENINVKLEGFALAFRLRKNLSNQLSFNNMIEIQLAQLAALVPAKEIGRISGQPEPSLENVKAITTRGGKSTRDPPYPNIAGTRQAGKEARPDSTTKPEEDEVAQPDKIPPQEYCDTTLLPFSQHQKKPSMDEQFARFMYVMGDVAPGYLTVEAKAMLRGWAEGP